MKITKTNKLLNPLRFVVSAMPEESTRYALNYLYINGDTAVVTDGRRIHWASHNSIDSIDDGFYKVVKNIKTLLILEKVNDAGNFPKWRDIIPQHEKYYNCTTEHWALIAADLGSLGIGINFEFLKPLALFDCEDLKVSFGEPARPIIFDTQSNGIACHAVIMPVDYKKPVIQNEATVKVKAKSNIEDDAAYLEL